MKLSKYAIAALGAVVAAGAFCQPGAHHKADRRQPVGDAGKELLGNALQHAQANYGGQRRASCRQVWSFSTGALRGHEGQPLVVGTTMYVHSAYPNHLYAIDLTKEGWPIKWKYTPVQNDRAVRGRLLRPRAQRASTSRRVEIFMTTLDGQVIALDAEHRQGSLEGPQRRSDARRDADHGRPHHQGQVSSSASPAVSSASAAGWRRTPSRTASSCGRRTAWARTADVKLAPDFNSGESLTTGDSTRAPRRGRASAGRTAAAARGAGMRTTPT